MKKAMMSLAAMLALLGFGSAFGTEVGAKPAPTEVQAVALNVHVYEGSKEVKDSKQEYIVFLHQGDQGQEPTMVSSYVERAYIGQAEQADCKSPVVLTPSKFKSGVTFVMKRSRGRIGEIDFDWEARGLSEILSHKVATGCKSGESLKIDLPMASTAGLSARRLWLPEDGAMVLVGESDVVVEGKHLRYVIEAGRSLK